MCAAGARHEPGIETEGSNLGSDAVAAALGCSMSVDAGTLHAIEDRFRRMKREMPQINRRQAMVLDGAEILSNDRGTAPGQWIGAAGDKVVIMLPGPPSELKSIPPSWPIAMMRESFGLNHIAW